MEYADDVLAVLLLVNTLLEPHRVLSAQYPPTVPLLGNPLHFPYVLDPSTAVWWIYVVVHPILLAVIVYPLLSLVIVASCICDLGEL